MPDTLALISYCGPAPVPADLFARWNFDPWLLAALAVAALCWHLSAGRQRISLQDIAQSTARSRALMAAMAVLAVAFVYCFLYYGWSLYTSRPQQIIAEHGQKLDAICIASTTRSRAEVCNIATR